MTFDAKESSLESGQPYELYLFATSEATWRYTSGPEEITFQGAKFIPEIIGRTNTTASQEVKGGHITVTIPADNSIAQLFVSFIPSTPLSLLIYRGHYGESESEMKVAFTGRVLLARFNTDDECELECAPDTEVLRRALCTALYQRQCNHILFDAGCGIVNAFWKITGTVSDISTDGITVTISACSSKANGWFNLGFLQKEFSRRMIFSHTGSQIVLINPMGGLQVGDEVTVYAGCDRTYDGAQGCVPKFNNGANFNGFQWIPEKNPFSSGLE
jgi:uncharacterized phage protein (TIGR02218 family)